MAQIDSAMRIGVYRYYTSKIDRIIAARRRLAAIYNQHLEGSPLKTPKVSEGNQPVYQSYVVLLPKILAAKRHTIIDQLKEKGIETTIGTWNMPMTSYFRNRYGYRIDEFPAADQACARSLTLPLFSTMTEEQVEFVCRALLMLCQ